MTGRKKHILRLAAAAILSAVLTLSVTEVTALADAPYKTYTVDGYGTVSETQTTYLPYETITKIGDETLNSPTDFTLLEDGTMYILDSGNARVVVSDLEGNLIKTFGEGTLVTPRGIFVTDEHITYVADRDAKQIFVFDENGYAFSGTWTGSGRIVLQTAPTTTTWAAASFVSSAENDDPTWTGTVALDWENIVNAGELPTVLNKYGIAASFVEIGPNGTAIGYFSSTPTPKIRM